MTALARWCRFNLVGVAGMAVQLAVLAALNRWRPGHALAVSLLALEITLLHNFLWHQRYTWRERRAPDSDFGRLLRFHLSNGAVSLTTTLLLVPLATRRLHLPVVASNVSIILLCSLANFAAADLWAFAPPRATAKHAPPPDILERLPRPRRGPLRGVHGQPD